MELVSIILAIILVLMLVISQAFAIYRVSRIENKIDNLMRIYEQIRRGFDIKASSEGNVYKDLKSSIDNLEVRINQVFEDIVKYLREHQSEKKVEQYPEDEIEELSEDNAVESIVEDYNKILEDLEDIDEFNRKYSFIRLGIKDVIESIRNNKPIVFVESISGAYTCIEAGSKYLLFPYYGIYLNYERIVELEKLCFDVEGKREPEAKKFIVKEPAIVEKVGATWRLVKRGIIVLL